MPGSALVAAPYAQFRRPGDVLLGAVDLAVQQGQEDVGLDAGLQLPRASATQPLPSWRRRPSPTSTRARRRVAGSASGSRARPCAPSRSATPSTLESSETVRRRRIGLDR